MSRLEIDFDVGQMFGHGFSAVQPTRTGMSCGKITGTSVIGEIKTETSAGVNPLDVLTATLAPLGLVIITERESHASSVNRNKMYFMSSPM